MLCVTHMVCSGEWVLKMQKGKMICSAPVAKSAHELAHNVLWDNGGNTPYVTCYIILHAFLFTF